MGYYLAIDIGKTVGHHMLGHLVEDKLQMEEIYRFENRIVENGGEQCWDLLNLFEEIKAGIIRCREIGKLPIFVGIDTWGVDFVLLDQEDKVIGNTIVNHNDDTMQQLIDIKEKHSDYLDKVRTLLMIPDYFNFLLTGVKLCEYTIASTTHLLSPVAEVWDEELIRKIGYSQDIFQEIRRPGTVLGNLTNEITEEVGYDCIIVLPATNANNSAIFALPPKDIDKNNNTVTGSRICAVGSDTEYSTAAVGNLLVQMIISHELEDVQAARECVQNSFVIR